MERALMSARSFRPRRRGLPPARAEQYARLAPAWTLSIDGPPLMFDELFGAGADVVLDIGFGGGEGLVEMAALRPDECIVGVEVHTPGVARVLDAIEANGWSHVRLVEGDVLELLPRVPIGSLAAVRVWFPDPWPKNKQRHRRLVAPQVVAALTDRLRVGGMLHVATDVDDYATHTLSVMSLEPRMAGGVVPRPDWRPVTRFEARGRRDGRTSTDHVYERMR